uniref:Expansin n=1 Tax=Pratylenchus penetrans TaxID=45929 RepID=A0A6G8RRP4_PRAPE|nr:expansin [Pratylenchus penetrans]
MAQFFIVAVLLLALPSICLGQKVVTTDPANAKINSCLAKNASQSSTLASNLNKPISGGQFTFYGNPSGAGACGQDTGKPAGFSAAASGKLFVDSQKWVAPCSGTQWVLSDQVCINKCVKITYKCVKCTASKTLTVPINNKCPECAVNHVDLSTDAFNYLEPQGGTVGIAKNAVITYITCP